MNKTQIKAAVIQMSSSDDSEYSWNQLRTLLDQVDDSHDLVSFPENALYIRVDSKSPLTNFNLGEPLFRELEKISAERNFAIHIGSVPCLRDGKTFNTSLWIEPNKEVEAVYDKIHLFDVDVEGQKPMRESDQFVHGSKPIVLNYLGWNIGFSICYDLRFSELYKYYSQQNVDLLLAPAAFLVPTGKAHWEVLLRARAIETQSYMLAAAQVGEHKSIKGGSRETFGHSMIVDPWGKILAINSKSEPGVISSKLDKSIIAKVREQIPMAQHRRL